MRIDYFLVGDNRGGSTAALNRVKLICRGLEEHGIECRIRFLCISTSSIKYIRYAWILKILFEILFFVSFAGKKDIFIFYGEFPFLPDLIKFKKKEAIWLVERNEYSTYQIKEGIAQKQIQKLKAGEVSLYKMDGLITCSSYLENYYKQFMSAQADSIVIPLIVDYALFQNKRIGNPEKMITYCGDFGGNKDGLPTLLEAFASLKDKYPEFKLCLIGDTADKKTIQALNLQIERLSLRERIILTGRIPHDDMPVWLSKASVLVLARPANKQAEGGIPSKLAEYLSTGRPVLVTRVGELDKYFVDEKDLFFAKPDSVTDFSIKLDYILHNYEDSRIIGMNGYRRVEEFDYKVQVLKLKRYLQEIYNS